MNKILGRINTASFRPILFAQTVSFLNIVVDNKKYSYNIQKELHKITTNLKENFKKARKDKNTNLSLAEWAEMTYSFMKSDPQFSETVAYWLARQQLQSGAFPSSTYSNFVYTRGTSKIFEVLALYPSLFQKELTKAFQWLFLMQYTKENTFFVAPEVRHKIIGGVRHDHFNQEAWIDSAGHLLLGGARLLENKQGY